MKQSLIGLVAVLLLVSGTADVANAIDTAAFTVESVCLEEAVSSAVATCATQNPACTVNPVGLAVSANDVAARAIALQRCEGRQFRRAS